MYYGKNTSVPVKVGVDYLPSIFSNVVTLFKRDVVGCLYFFRT